jgi:hypothetical protein
MIQMNLKKNVTSASSATASMKYYMSGVHHIRCVMSPATLVLAVRSNVFSTAQIEYMQKTQSSRDPRDVVWHRAVTNQVNPDGSERKINNDIMHALEHDDVDARIVNAKFSSCDRYKRDRK